jgi:hypothetical protein
MTMMNRMNALRSLVFAALALSAAASQACRLAPAAQRIAVEDEVRQPADVMVGQVVGATPLGGDAVEYSFLVLDQMRGLPRKVFTVLGRAVSPYDQDTSYDRHRDFAFWARYGGRSMHAMDCVIHPGFVVGNSYLVFLGAAPTRRSFEKIDMVDGHPDAGDKWLAYVKTALSGTPAGQDATPDYERIGRLIYGLQRMQVQGDLDRQALAAQHAPDQLLMRAGRLGDEFERMLKEPGNAIRVPNEKIDAALREAASLHAALETWRNGAAR